MPENLCSRAFDSLRLFVAGGLRDRVPECLSETRDDGRVVSSEVVQFDRLGCTIVLFRMFRGANENLLVVVMCVVQLEKGCPLLDDATL